MSRTIYVVTESGAQAQYEVDMVEAMWKAGQLKPDSLYWMEGMNEWRPLEEYFAPPSPGTGGPPPPSPALQVEGTTFHGYGGFWKRAVAILLDGIVMVIIGGVIGVVIGGFYGAYGAAGGGASPEAAETANWLGRLIGTIAGWLYFALMESSSKQATLGKMALDMKVTDEEGRRIGFGRATGRHFAKYISVAVFLIGYFMAAFTKRKQALHDMIAGCLVVND